jgi:hypothetical protein
VALPERSYHCPDRPGLWAARTVDYDKERRKLFAVIVNPAMPAPQACFFCDEQVRLLPLSPPETPS